MIRSGKVDIDHFSHIFPATRWRREPPCLPTLIGSFEGVEKNVANIQDNYFMGDDYKAYYTSFTTFRFLQKILSGVAELRNNELILQCLIPQQKCSIAELRNKLVPQRCGITLRMKIDQ